MYEDTEMRAVLAQWLEQELKTDTRTVLLDAD